VPGLAEIGRPHYFAAKPRVVGGGEETSAPRIDYRVRVTYDASTKLLRKRDYPTGKFTLAFVGYGDEADSTVIELTHNWDQKDPYQLGSAFGHLAIGVPDVYKTCEKLAAADVKIPRPAGPMAHGGSVIAFIEDPDGYRIELVERA